MTELSPLELLLEEGQGTDILVAPALSRLYGRLGLPAVKGRPCVIANFASTLDGVVAFSGSSHSGGGEITGLDPHDRMVMGLLRSVADAIVVGAGTLRSVPSHLWTPQEAYPPLSSAYAEERRLLGLSERPLNVIVSASGELDLSLPVFNSDDVRPLIVTTTAGDERLKAKGLAQGTRLATVAGSGRIEAKAIIGEIERASPCRVILLEGGPQLMAQFLSERIVDELFLTIAAQIAGRTAAANRPGFVSGKTFAPEDPLWGKLRSVRRAGDMLFLRYSPGSPSDGPEVAAG